MWSGWLEPNEGPEGDKQIGTQIKADDQPIEDESRPMSLKNGRKDEGRVTFLAFGFVTVVWIVTAGIVGFFGKTKVSGEFGDSFGTITALFSGLAFAGIIITLYLQRGDLQLQREMLEAQYEELKATREELAGQKEQMELQNRFIERQNFEATFFRLIESFNLLISSFTEMRGRPDNRHTLTGREVLEGYASRLTPGWVRNVRTPRTSEQEFQNYMKLFNDSEEHLGPYFRTLLSLLQYLDTHVKETSVDYVSIFESQLSKHELHLILMHSAFHAEAKELKSKAEKFCLLKNLPNHYRDNHPSAFEKIAASAFGSTL